MKLKKVSQMEIMGMVIVVALIAIGLFFIISFQIGQKPTDIKQRYQESELAANILNVLLKTNIPECKNLDIAELFRDCAFLKRVYCQGIDSCSKVDEVATTILKETLDNAGYKNKYYFTAKLGAETKAEVGTKCSGNVKSKTFPLPTDVGTAMIVRLDICS